MNHDDTGATAKPEAATPTPRTDAEIRKYEGYDEANSFEWIDPDFARALERELAEAKANWHGASKEAVAVLASANATIETLTQQLADAQRERDDARISFNEAHSNAARWLIERDAARAEVERLEKGNIAANVEAARLRSSLADANKEVERLEEQVHDMCHDLHIKDPSVSVSVFCDGCEAYQIEKFGESPITKLRSDLSRANKEVEGLKAEVELLSKRNETQAATIRSYQQSGRPEQKCIDSLRSDLSRANAAVAAMREALTDISKAEGNIDKVVCLATITHCRERAKLALSSTQDPGMTDREQVNRERKRELVDALVSIKSTISTVGLGRISFGELADALLAKCTMASDASDKALSSTPSLPVIPASEVVPVLEEVRELLCGRRWCNCHVGRSDYSLGGLIPPHAKDCNSKVILKVREDLSALLAKCTEGAGK